MLELKKARDALFSIPPDISRDEWIKVGMAAQAAGLAFDDFNDWSAQAANYEPTAASDAWKSFKLGKGIGPGTLFKTAATHGWRKDSSGERHFKRQRKGPRQAKLKGCSESNAVEVWNRCEPATHAHPYVVAKGAEGVPLESLRVVPVGDPLRIMGESMVGALVLPISRPDGTLSSLQFITPPETAKRLKEQRKTDKPNLPGASLDGWLTVGALTTGGVAYVCEGIGAAWACWKATGKAAVVCFGWGRVKTVTEELRQQDPSARLVLVPDVGKETQAAEIARVVGVEFVVMPGGWPSNSDVCDLALRDGFDALESLLINPQVPAKRFRLLSGADLVELPPLRWLVRGVLPAEGVAALYGPSASGKSFLALDMAAAIAEGNRWFECRVNAAPVVYAALEGEAGFRTRVLAWEARYGRKLPDGLRLMLQPFKLTTHEDVRDLAAVVPVGAVVFLDTLNRAAPTADENSSTDMGVILESTKRLQALTGGLVCLIHHTGKNESRGLRGHSSLFAALDAAVEVSRDGERRAWKVAKSKDGQDGNAHPFRLQVEMLGADEYGDAITSCSVLPDQSAQDVLRVKLPQGGNQRIALDALIPMFKTCGKPGKAGAPALSLCLQLDIAVRAVAAALPVEPARKTERARASIISLTSRGVLACNEGWLWQI